MHIGDQLSAYLDSQVDRTARGSIEAHLGGCADCRAELEAVGMVRSRLRELPFEEPPPGALDLPAEVIPLRRGRRILVAAAAASALVVGIGFGVNGNQTVPLQLDAVVEQHVARASVDPGFNVMQVQAVLAR